MAKHPPTHTPCPSCQAPTITGPPEGTDPTITLNPARLTTLGELQAITTGHTTYAIDQWSTHIPIHRRDTWSITNCEPQPDTYTIHAPHQCGQPPYDHYPTPEPKQAKP